MYATVHTYLGNQDVRFGTERRGKVAREEVKNMQKPSDARLAFALVEDPDGTGVELVTYVPDGRNPIAVDIQKPELAELEDLTIACQQAGPRIRRSLAAQLPLLRT